MSLGESSSLLSHFTMLSYHLTLTKTLFQLNHCDFPIKMLVTDFLVGLFCILFRFEIASSPAWYCSQKSQSDFPGNSWVRRIGISSLLTSSSSRAVRGFRTEDDSSTVETDWEWASEELEATDAEPEPEATGISVAWSKSVCWWTAAEEMAKGLKKD